MKHWRRLILLMGTMLMTTLVAAEEPLAVARAGRVERQQGLAFRNIDPRPVDVWLPENYSPSKRYQVLYMHDGQMLFDPATTWNKQSWNVDLTLTRLKREGKIADTIVVGIWNNGKFRHSEYFPQKFLPLMADAPRERLIREGLQNKPQADAYLRFLVEELKPAIDARYSTLTDAAHTFLMGSSMGGLISVYALCEYPSVFGGAAGLSTHWMGGFAANSSIPLAAFNYLRDRLPDPATHRLYQDHGTTELDTAYAPYQTFINQIVRDRGYSDTNFSTRVFEGTGHNERVWAERLEIPLLFLLGK